MGKVLIDCRLVGSGGVERVFDLLIKYYPGNSSDLILLCNHEHRSFFDNFGLQIITTHLKPMSVKSSLMLDYYVSFKKFDFVIFPNAHFHIALSNSTKFIYFVNDLFHIDCVERNWRSYLKALVLYFSIRLIIKQSTIVLTISEFSAKRILETFSKKNINNLKILNPIVVERVKKRSLVKAKTDVLSIGTIRPHKNQYALFAIAKRYPELTVKIIGKMGSDEEYNQLISKTAALHPNVHLLTKCSDSDIDTNFESALCVVQCSLYEGFGLPVIEAQRQGVPVLCSDIPVFREIAKESAWYFDPRDEENIVKEFTAFRSCDISSFINKGYENCSKYSSDVLASQYRDIIF